MSAADRERRRRERRKAGDRCYRITVNEIDLECALEDTPFLPWTGCERRQGELQQALQRLIDFLLSEDGSVTRHGLGRSDPVWCAKINKDHAP